MVLAALYLSYKQIIMRPLLIILLSLIANICYSQNQNVAVIVDENPGKFDVVFFSKIILLFVIAIIALVSYVKYQKEEKGFE